ncbi:MAG: DJ-1/PfpI family protein [Lachnospiraceae bacterium]|nr:DJ-1/PfpI family protein [Lachnospiraceae bacterium]
MNTYIFLYPETSFFEVNLVAYFMKTKGNVFIVTERENKIICTNEGVKILSDAFIDEVQVEDIDAFIICGGEIKNISNKPLLYNIINKCKEKNKIVGGICAGRDLVKNAIDLVDHSEKTCVIDNIILSPGYEYVDFALEVGRKADIFEDEDDYKETINFFKFFQHPE